MKKIIISLILLLGISGAIYLYGHEDGNETKIGASDYSNDQKLEDSTPDTDLENSDINEEELIACTADAMQCPDGTYVGRTGPRCEFICPNPKEIINISNEIVSYLKEGDIASVKKYIHPIKGVRITIDGYVIENHDVILKPSELDYLLDNNTVLMWGYSDGKGDPINLSVEDFFKKYFSHDYTTSDPVVNEIRQGGSNSIDNFEKVYLNKDFVNYYIPYASTYMDQGIEKPQTLDWHALNFVFEEYEGIKYIIGIIKDNWTI